MLCVSHIAVTLIIICNLTLKWNAIKTLLPRMLIITFTSSNTQFIFLEYTLAWRAFIYRKSFLPAAINFRASGGIFLLIFSFINTSKFRLFSLSLENQLYIQMCRCVHNSLNFCEG